MNAQPLTADGFVTLTGFADRQGKSAYNKDLGQRRADAVRDHLRQLVTDQNTKNNIRTRSMGEPTDGPVVSDPGLRKVEIEITRPSPPPNPPPTPVPDLTPSRGKTKEILEEQEKRRGGPPKQPVQPGVNLPADFWKEIPKGKPKPVFVKQLSDWATKKLGREELAKIAGQLADGLGIDRARAQRWVNDALKDAGEAGVKKLLNEIAERVASELPQ